MLSSTALRRVLVKSNALSSSSAVFGRQQQQSAKSAIRLLSSVVPPSNNNKNDNKLSKQLQQRKVHGTARTEADAAQSVVESATAATSKKEEEETSTSSGLMDRFVVTAEVTVSKIFPAGFGWQTSSIIAENNFGFAPDTMSFAYTTGLGDAIGVLAGHTLFYAAKKAALSDASIDMKREVHTGILLASAAFCSGTVWQPLVNALQGANLSFTEVFTGTWIGCGTAFYLGLRASRSVLSGYLEHVHEPTYENSKNDLTLSISIGGATGFFVGTDAAYLPEQNFLIDVVGISDGTPDLTGCAIAGTSTALGFVTSQTAFNMIYPAGKLWND